jgi:hypothetical protein
LKSAYPALSREHRKSGHQSATPLDSRQAVRYSILTVNLNKWE